MKEETKAFWKHFVVIAIIMTLCFILFELWDPIERMILGRSTSGKSLASFITLKRDIPVIVAVSLIFARAKVKRKRNDDTGSMQP